MDESNLQRLCNVDLQKDEVDCTVLDNQDIDDGLKEADLSILVQIHSERSINLDGFKVAMGKAWQCDSFSIQKVDESFLPGFLR